MHDQQKKQALATAPATPPVELTSTGVPKKPLVSPTTRFLVVGGLIAIAAAIMVALIFATGGPRISPVSSASKTVEN